MAPPSQRLLRQVTKPARYTGGEWNSRRKPWDSVAVRICLLYPEVYEVGAVRPALSSLYQALNDDPAVLAERAFAPWPDFARALRSDHLPLSSLESGSALNEFDILAVCLPSELAATTVLEMLDLAWVPLVAGERNDRHPLVVGWEERPSNPEPLTEFLDAYLIGDAEAVFPGLLRALREQGERPERAGLLRRIAAEPGVYVPSLYTASHSQDGVSQETSPMQDTPPRVRRLVWTGLHPIPTRPVVPYLQTVPDRAMVEVQRGCEVSCQTVLLGLANPPARQHSAGEAVEALRETLRTTGLEEITLAAACFRHYPEREKLIAAAIEACGKRTATFRLPQIPLELLSAKLTASLQEGHGAGPLALGPEVANEDLSQALRPGGFLDSPLTIVHEGTMKGAFKNLRLEVVLAHPTSSSGGWQAASALVRALRQAAGPQARLHITASLFVRRAFTPWQWSGQPPLATLQAEIEALRSALGRRMGFLAEGNAARAQVEAALACGDRRLGRVIRRAWATGCVLDSWDELFRPDLWHAAFRAEGLDLEIYGQARNSRSALPWSHLEGPSEALLMELANNQIAAAAARKG